jgi:hypothetical protein
MAVAPEPPAASHSQVSTRTHSHTLGRSRVSSLGFILSDEKRIMARVLSDARDGLGCLYLGNHGCNLCASPP